MKVVDIRAYPLKTRTALVRVFTDDGTEGIGECSPMNVPVTPCRWRNVGRAR